MNVFNKSPGCKYVCKTLPYFFILDRREVIFNLQDFDQRQKAVTLFDSFRNSGERLGHRIETGPTLDLETEIFLFVLISLVRLWGARCLGHESSLLYIRVLRWI